MKCNMKIKIVFVFFLLCQTVVNAQWSLQSSINNEVCISSNSQVDPRIISDSKEGAIICWTDFRLDVLNKLADVYIQRIKKNGSTAWAVNGVGVCTNSADQNSPLLVEDSKGGAIVVWQDKRNGNWDIYAQRIDSNGTALWALNGIAVAQKSTGQYNPRIISDGGNGAIVVWEDSINGSSDIYAQKLNDDGTLAWTANGVVVNSSLGDQTNARIISDGVGGAIISWQDKRNGNDYDIYAQRIIANGSASWTANGIPICVRVNTQNNPKIESDNNGGAYIVWQDKRGAIDFDIYAQRVNATGTVQWVANGVIVCNATGSQSAIDATTDGVVGGIIITWKDGRTVNNHIYSQFLNSNGVSQWAANGILISSSVFPQLNPNIVGVGNNEAIVVWQDSISNLWDVYSQKINTQGNLLWTVGGVCVSNAVSNQVSPKNVSNGNGGCIYAFQDKRNGNQDIFAWQLKSNGTPTKLMNYEVDESSFNVFPNPSNNYFYISAEEEISESIILNIYNSFGSLVYTKTIFAGSKNTSIVHNLPQGVYVLNCRNINSGFEQNSKFIVNE